MGIEFKTEGWKELMKDFEDLAKDSPKVLKLGFKKIGNKFTRYVRKRAKKETKKRSGAYLKAFKTSRVWKKGNEYGVSTYNKTRQAVFIEYGWTHHKTGKYYDGKHVIEKAKNAYEQNYLTDDLNDVINDVLAKI